MSYSRDDIKKEPHLSAYGTFTLMGTTRLKAPDGLSYIRKNFVYRDNFIPFSISFIFSDEEDGFDFVTNLNATFETFKLHFIAHLPRCVRAIVLDEDRYAVVVQPKENSELYTQTSQDPALYHHILLSAFDRYVDIARIPQIDWSVEHSQPLEDVKARMITENIQTPSSLSIHLTQ